MGELTLTCMHNAAINTPLSAVMATAARAASNKTWNARNTWRRSGNELCMCSFCKILGRNDVTNVGYHYGSLQTFSSWTHLPIGLRPLWDSPFVQSALQLHASSMKSSAAVDACQYTCRWLHELDQLTKVVTNITQCRRARSDVIKERTT
jgi:hypothetical protein